MESKERISTAIADIDEIKDLLEYFRSESDMQISGLEIDLLKKKLIDVYDTVTGLSFIEKDPVKIPKEKIAEDNRYVELESREEVSPGYEAETGVEIQNEQESTNGISPKILGEKFKKSDSLNEKLTIDGKKDVRSKLQSSPIKDLSKSMGLNDRFIYTKELFSGNRQLFKDVMDKLNNMNSFDEAEKYLEQFGWSPDDEYVIDFKDKVKRRFQ
jgi:hypothetical protein